MIKRKIKRKPLSVNEAWKGQRERSYTYSQYARDLGFLMRSSKKKLKGKLRLYVQFGLSNANMDIDNPLKPLLDIMQKKYGFNDNKIYRLEVDKVLVKKGKEFIYFELGELDAPPICANCNEVDCECGY